MIEKIGLIIGSPKGKDSISFSYAMLLKEYLSKENIEYKLFFAYNDLINNQDIEEISICSRLILIFPLYVDAIPSKLIEYMKSIEISLKNTIKNIKVYSVVNCGFPESFHNKIALNMIEIFSKKADLLWRFGIGIGEGTFFNEFTKRSPSLKFLLIKRIIPIVDNIIDDKDKTQENMYFDLPILNFIFIFIAHKHWINIAKKNKLQKYQLKEQPSF
ncbi:hypothetical protein [Cetobacterium sp.]|uniref:hypothetical protein n=1 Tax=Cetobacterium sp. TaxID=2071632 RepID=UPI002FCC5F03